MNHLSTTGGPTGPNEKGHRCGMALEFKNNSTSEYPAGGNTASASTILCPVITMAVRPPRPPAGFMLCLPGENAVYRSIINRQIDGESPDDVGWGVQLTSSDNKGAGSTCCALRPAHPDKHWLVVDLWIYGWEPLSTVPVSEITSAFEALSGCRSGCGWQDKYAELEDRREFCERQMDVMGRPRNWQNRIPKAACWIYVYREHVGLISIK